MPFDAHKNFARSLVATAPSPATTGTSLVVTAAEGVKFPAVPFNAVVAPAGTLPSSTNAEIVRVTAIATDTLTITRAQEDTTARTIATGDQIVAAITAKSLVDVEVALSQIEANTQAASYTLVAADAGKSIEMNLGTATVLTVPTNATVPFPIGTVIEVLRLGAGTVTLTPATGVVLRNRLEAAGTTSRTITSQYSTVSFRKRAVDEWVLVGDFA